MYTNRPFLVYIQTPVVLQGGNESWIIIFHELHDNLSSVYAEGKRHA